LLKCFNALENKADTGFPDLQTNGCII